MQHKDKSHISHNCSFLKSDVAAALTGNYKYNCPGNATDTEHSPPETAKAEEVVNKQQHDTFTITDMWTMQNYNWANALELSAENYRGIKCITKTRLFKYIENFTIQNWKFFR